MFGHFQIIFKFMVSPGLCLIHPLLINYLTLANKSSLVILFLIHGWEAGRKENKTGFCFELSSILQKNCAPTNGQVVLGKDKRVLQSSEGDRPVYAQ